MAEPGSPIHPFFRAVLGLEVFFGVASLATIGLFPDQTATKFAWKIASLPMAGVLAGLYMAAAPTLVMQFVARRWEMIRVMILPALAFTTAELVPTVLHWDKFFVGTLPFNIWLASYVLPPPLLLTMYIRQQKRTVLVPPEGELPGTMRLVFCVLGALFTVEAVYVMFVPSRFIASYPFALTPLTARVLAGWLIMIGVLLLSAARENDKARVRIVSPILILVLPAVGAQIVRFRSDVDLGHPRIVANLFVLGFLFACGLYLARGDWRKVLT